MSGATTEPAPTGRRGLLALLLGGTTAALTLAPKPAEAEPSDAIDGGTP